LIIRDRISERMTMTQLAERARFLDGYASEEEAAQEFNVTSQTMRRWRRLRKGPPWVMTPGGVKYPIEEGRQWLRNNTFRPGT
jgi:hypothetical protein